MSCLKLPPHLWLLLPSFTLERVDSRQLGEPPPALGARAAGCSMYPCLHPSPLSSAAGRRQRSVLLTKFIKGIIYVFCIFLGLTAKNGKQHWGTLIVRWLEQQLRPGQANRDPPAIPYIPANSRGSRQGEGAGGIEDERLSNS